MGDRMGDRLEGGRGREGHWYIKVIATILFLNVRKSLYPSTKTRRFY